MAELHPFALRRILALRQFPILCDAEIADLALIAENVTEVTLPAGAPVAAAGSPFTGLHLILHGEIATTGSQIRTWRSHQVFGALEVLAHRDAAASAVATVETTTLQLLAPDLTDVLEDSFGVMLAALRALAGAVALRSRRGPTAAVPPAPSLGLVERLIVLRQQMAFGRAPLEPLVALAHTSDEVALPPGTIVTRAGGPGSSSYVIIEGTSAATHASGAARMLGPGDAIGHLEILGGLPHEETVEVIQPVRALKVDAAALFDVLEDHTDMGRAIMAVLASDLLDTLPAS